MENDDNKMEKKRGSRISKKQIDILINYIQENQIMLSGKLNQKDQANVSKKWEELANMLNTSGGAKKNVVQWKKTFSELKTNTKRRAREVYHAKHGTGGGPSKIKDLSDVEERLMGLLAKVSVEGSTIPEPGLMMHTEENILVFDLEECTTVINADSTIINSNGNNDLPKQTPVSKRRSRPDVRSNFEAIIDKQAQSTEILAESVNKLSDAIKFLADAIEKLATKP